MTRVEFFFNVEDKLKKLVELSEQAVEKNLRLTILMRDETAAQTAQQYFWQQSAAFCPIAVRRMCWLSRRQSLLIAMQMPRYRMTS